MEKKCELTDEIDIVYLRGFANFLFDNPLLICLFSNQVLEKHLDSKRVGCRNNQSSVNLKALTRCMLHAYNGIVGCSYAIQYPLWGKHNDGLTTVFFSTRRPYRVVNEKRLSSKEFIMNILITISEKIIDRETVKTVNARELHTFLEVGRDFTTWIKDRINQYEFEEGNDFIKTQDLRSPKLGSAKSRAVTVIDYHLTLDMAKELSMIERNEKGRQARRYFIECEKKLRSQSVDSDNDTRFDLPSYWEGMNAGEKVLYLLSPIHMRLIDAFRVDEENRQYKALIKEAKQLLARSIVKAA